ncbi:hypothetical protein ABR157_002300 [Enterobacter soli]
MITSRRKLLSILPASLLLCGGAWASNKQKKEAASQSNTEIFTTPQSYGIEPGNHINGEAMSRMISAGGDIRFIKPGTYITDRTLIIPSFTRIWIGSGVTIKLADNSNCNIFQNKAFNEKSTDPDEVIEITGLGEIDFNGKNQKTSGLTHMCSILKNIKNLSIGGGIKVLNANKYAWLVAKIEQFTADGLVFDTHSDGLHCQPPIQHAYIRNLKGKTGDDMLAFTIGDYAQYNISEIGGFSDVDVSGIFCDNALCAVKITGDGTGVFKNFRVNGIYGNTQHAVFRIWGDTNLTGTKIQNLTVENIYAMAGDSYSTVEVDDRGFGKGDYGIEIDNAIFRGIYASNISAQTIYISGTYGSLIKNITLENLPDKALTLVGLNQKNVKVINLSILNTSTSFEENPNSTVVLNRGDITRLNINNVYANFKSEKNGSIARLLNACTVTHAYFTNVTQVNGARSWDDILKPMVNPSELTMDGFILRGNGRLVQTLGSTLRVNLSGCSVITDTKQESFFANGGEIILSGNVKTNDNCVGIASGGVVKIESGINNILCDISMVNAERGCVVRNSNKNLSCGDGMVIYNGHSWKNMETGKEYVKESQ